MRKKCEVISGLCPAAGGLAEVSTPLFHCYTELFILAEFSVSSALWIMSQRQRGAKKKTKTLSHLNKISPATIGHMNCESVVLHSLELSNPALIFKKHRDPFQQFNPAQLPPPTLVSQTVFFIFFYFICRNGCHPTAVL